MKEAEDYHRSFSLLRLFSCSSSEATCIPMKFFASTSFKSFFFSFHPPADAFPSQQNIIWGTKQHNGILEFFFLWNPCDQHPLQANQVNGKGETDAWFEPVLPKHEAKPMKRMMRLYSAYFYTVVLGFAVVLNLMGTWVGQEIKKSLNHYLK